jgi:LemA protein
VSTIAVFLFALVAVAAAAAWIAVATGNRLVSLDARCRTAHADIDVYMKRRADLIPGLVECVRGFAAHEAGILGDVIEARKVSLQMAPEARAQTEAALGRKVGSVLSLAEKYPDLAASPHFRELRQELVATEERITASRRFFNLAVEEYNATLARFPGNLVAARRRLAERRPFDLGVERMVLDEPAAIRF